MAMIGRNSPCPCGSGRKYKKCCLSKDGHQARPLSRGFDAAAAEDQEERLASEPDEIDDRYAAESKEEIEWVQVKTTSAPLESPQIDDEPPPTSAAEQLEVDAWWREFAPFFKNRNTDQMLLRIHRVLDTRPDLFEHLSLHEECLFELGEALARRGAHSRYIDLLLRIRREQPRAYLRSHGWFDRDVITAFLLNGRRSEVTKFFDLFQAYPDSFPDALMDVVNLLLATNCDTELFNLAHHVGVPLALSPRVHGGRFLIIWQAFEQLLPTLDGRDTSEEGIQRAWERIDALDLPADIDRDEMARDIKDTLGEFPAPSATDLRDRNARKRLHMRVMRHFTAWLHDHMGLSWPSARYFALAVNEVPIAPGGAKALVFRFLLDEETLDHCIVQTCMRFMWIDGIKAYSLLQGIWWFASYLAEHRVEGHDPTETIQATCRSLAKKAGQLADASNPGSRLFPDFSAYRWAASR